MEESSLIIEQYAKNPLCNFVLSDYTVKRHEGNFICWDDITVYLKIIDDTVVDYSYDWNCSIITLAAASFLSELIIWASINKVISRTYLTISSAWFHVSPRRRRASVIALLATKNAIYQYLWQNREDSFDDLIDE